MERLLLATFLGAFAMLTGNAQEPTAVLKNGVITVSTGDYQATFSFGHRWNLSSLNYGNVPIITPGGANQFIVKGRQTAGEGTWYGGIGNAETIESVTLHVDEDAYPLDANEPGDNRIFSPGEVYAIEKHSQVGPYEVRIRTTLTPDGITEKISFTAINDTERIDFIYPSRFSFAEGFTSWFAILEDGFEEDGEIGGKGSTSINRATRGLALRNEASGHVIVLRTIEESEDLGSTHFLWNTGNKISFHSQIPPISKEAGQIEILRSLSISSIEQGTDDWRELARKSLQKEN